MEANDFIFYTENSGNNEYTYRGGGYAADSNIAGGGPVKKDGVSTILKNLAIPTSVFLIPPMSGGSSMSYLIEDDYDIQNGGKKESADETISDDLFDKLLKLVQVDNMKTKKHATRKNKVAVSKRTSNKSTRKNV
jgi:hypothetical protein